MSGTAAGVSDGLDDDFATPPVAEAILQHLVRCTPARTVAAELGVALADVAAQADPNVVAHAQLDDVVHRLYGELEAPHRDATPVLAVLVEVHRLRAQLQGAAPWTSR